MSVINKMLRDLDHRANPGAAAPSGPATLRHGTASVHALGTLDARESGGLSAARMWLAVGLLAAAAAAGGGWWWWTASSADTPPLPQPTPPVQDSAGSAATPVATAASAPQAVASAPVAQTSNTPANAAEEPTLGTMTLRMEPSLSARKALDALLSAPAPAPASNSSPTPVASRSATAPAPPTPTTVAPVAPQAATASPSGTAPATAPSAERPGTRSASTAGTAKAPTAAAADSTPVLQRQQQAGGDALSQVQALWNSGSRDAALELMQQSIAAAERSVRAGTAPGSSTVVLVPLVREMARMQLAESRFGAVWEMLTKLEPLLGNQPDLWAIRANAAQRLGRHQDSVHAYMVALQSRPDEQRWLLGAAVSLAALGQTSSAAEMADKARSIGPVSKEIVAYLRQTGVPIREQ